MDSLAEKEQDPARQLLEPTSSRGKRPFLISDFISCLPIILQEDRETVLGTSGDAKIILMDLSMSSRRGGEAGHREGF